MNMNELEPRELLKSIVKTLRNNDTYKEELEGVLNECLDLISRVGNSDGPLVFFLSKILNDRLMLWEQEIRTQDIDPEISEGRMNTLGRVFNTLDQLAKEMYLSNGGIDIERGKELIHNNINHEGLITEGSEDEMLQGLGSMVKGFKRFAGVDLYTVQVNLLNLRYLIESVIESNDEVKKAWKDYYLKDVIEIISSPLEGFYPSLR